MTDGPITQPISNGEAPQREPRFSPASPRRPLGLVRCLLIFVCGRRYRREEGQVLPLAAIGLLATVLAVLATVNLSDAVYNKIKLQNTADSAAYTLAAMEARTFNYIAFLNRAQIAHYNTAAMVQSYITWVGSHVAIMGTAGDLFASMASVFQICMTMACSHPSCTSTPPVWPCNPVCPICSWGYYAASVAAQVPLMSATVMAGFYQGAARMGHWIVEAMSIFNRHVIWKAQAWRAVLMNGVLLSGVQGYIEKNDPELAIYRGGRNLLNTVINSTLNSYEYWVAFDESAGVNPQAFAFLSAMPRMLRPDGPLSLSDVRSEAKRSLGSSARDSDGEGGATEAYRVMTQLSNASRFPEFVHDRAVGSTSILGLPGLQMQMGKFGTTRFAPAPDSELTSPIISALTRPGSEDEVGTSLSSHDAWGGTMGLSSSLFDLGIPSEVSLAIGDAIAATKKEDGSDGDHYLYEPTALQGLFPVIRDLGASDNLIPILKGVQERLSAMSGKVQTMWDDSWGQMKDKAQAVVGGGAEEGGAVAEAVAEPGTASEAGGVLSKGLASAEAAMEKIKEALEVGQMAMNLIRNAPQMIATYIQNAVVSQVKEIAKEIGKEMAKRLLKRIGTRLFGPDAGTSIFSSMPGLMSLMDRLIAIENSFGTEQHAKWPGFAPYFKFNACPDRARDFCQPSTWIFLSKPYEQFVAPEGKLTPSQSVFSWEQGRFKVNIDTTSGWNKNIFMFQGLNAISRGMAYYHCIGNWGEQPNFFNPCWRARLAPVGQKLNAYFSKYAAGALGLSELPLGNQLQNVALGAMGDLFAATVTTLITH